MNGTVFGGTVDPRMSRMLAPAPDGQFRGVDPNVAGYRRADDPATAEQLLRLRRHGAQLPGRYLFYDKARSPSMTYAELQFIKAEAAYRAGDKATALAAYRNAITAHIDWVNTRNLDDGQAPLADHRGGKDRVPCRSEYRSDDPAELTLTQIMSQKYIALWGWGHNELWLDMRRYHYTDIDPASGKQVYPGFAPPTNLYPDNAGKIVQRIRPRFNSEYVWNCDGLNVIGGLAVDLPHEAALDHSAVMHMTRYRLFSCAARRRRRCRVQRL